jgi:hypothetical protein
MSSFLFDDDIQTISAQQVLNAFKDDPRFIRLSRSDFIGKEIAELAALIKITNSKSKIEKC